MPLVIAVISNSEKFAYTRKLRNLKYRKEYLQTFYFVIWTISFFQNPLCNLSKIRFESIFYFALFPQDIHYLALDKGELALAEVARKRASDIDAESITSGVGKN